MVLGVGLTEEGDKVFSLGVGGMSEVADWTRSAQICRRSQTGSTLCVITSSQL